MGNRNRMGGNSAAEALDTTPMEMPLGACRPAPLQDIIARMVREEISREKHEEFETMEEADDFEEEDPDTLDFSRYELSDVQEEVPFDLEEPQSLPPEKKKRTPKEVLDEAYGAGNYPEHWLTGDAPDPKEPEPS